MILDRQILRALGWSDGLIDAAERAAVSLPGGRISPVLDIPVDEPVMSAASDRVETGDTPPIALAEVRSF